MHAPRALLICSCLLAAAAVPAWTAASTVYKWVDDNGVVNYTTTPPPEGRTGKGGKAVTVDVAPAAAGSASPQNAESQYWRARAEREAARDLADARQRRETEALRQAQLRQELAAAERESGKKTAAQLAVEQCRAERRIDCESGVAGGGVLAATVAYPQVVVVTRPARTSTATTPYFSSPPNFTPGFSGMMMPSR